MLKRQQKGNFFPEQAKTVVKKTRYYRKLK
jgi:hypothetical protein